MYDTREIEISRKHLVEVVNSLDEPIVVLGGWAVYFLVNEGYSRLTGRSYIGSRDIDLGFRMMKEGSKDSQFAKSYGILTGKLGFRQVSFRLFKEVHAETGEVLDAESAKRLPGHQIFQMYVDLIVDSIPPDFMEHFGFTPIDEPLLEHVFDSESNRIELEEFGRMLWVPTPDILLATKIKSYPTRDKYDKRIKDLCDISALLMFTPGTSEEKLKQLLGLETINDFTTAISREDMLKASSHLNIDLTVIESAILRGFPGILLH